MTALSLATLEGALVLDSFDDDAIQTLPISIPPDLTPATLRLLSDAISATVERIAADFESMANGRPVLVGSHAAAARVRSMQALRRAA